MTKISGLPDGSSAIAAADLVPFVDESEGTTKRLLVGALAHAALGWFNVNDPAYGAVHDGTTDDSAAIQAAADAAGSAGGGVVLLPSAGYAIGAGIVLTSAHAGVVFMGAGRNVTRLTKAFNGDLFTLTAAPHVRWAGMTLDGLHGTYTGRAIVLSGASDYPIVGADVLITAFTSEAVRFEADAGRRARVACDFYPGTGQTDAKYVWIVGADTVPCYRRFVDCIAEAGYFAVDGADDTVFDHCQVRRVEIDSTSSITCVIGGIWGNSGTAVTIDGSVTRIMGLRISGDVTLSSTMTGCFIGNVQTSGTFTNNTGSGQCLVMHHPLSAGYVRIGEHSLTASVNPEEIQTRRVSGNNGDASVTLTLDQGANTLMFNTALTADRTVTLPTGRDGYSVRVVRQAGATGSFSINVGTGPLASLTQPNTECEVTYSGPAAAWVLTRAPNPIASNGTVATSPLPLAVGTTPATSGEVRVPNGSSSGVYARNAADTANVALVNLTSSDNVTLGGANASNVDLSNGTDTVRMAAGGHFKPTVAGTQDLGISSLPWNRAYARRVIGAGTAHVAGDYAASAGFGSTATVTVTGARDTGGRVSVASSGTGQAANPTLILTFKDGTWTTAPSVVCQRGDTLATAGRWALSAVTATTATFTFVGTPVAGETYILDFIAVGK